MKLTEQHLAKLKHAIGMDNKDAKNGVYEAYRNASFYVGPDETWEELVDHGYAMRNVDGKDHIYNVTTSGMQVVADATGLLIRYNIEIEPKKEIRL